VGGTYYFAEYYIIEVNFMPLEITDRLNILGAEITLLGDGLAVLAARKQYRSKEDIGRRSNKSREVCKLGSIIR
jgi:hypothetical protein